MKLQNLPTLSLILCLVNTFVGHVESIMVVLGENRKSFCITKSFTTHAVMKLSYLVSGENEKVVKSIIVDEGKKILFEKSGESFGSFEEPVKEVGNYKLCFELTEVVDTIISFEFVDLTEISHIQNLAKEDTFSMLNGNLTTISTNFEEIEKSLKFYAERAESHNHGKITK